MREAANRLRAGLTVPFKPVPGRSPRPDPNNLTTASKEGTSQPASTSASDVSKQVQLLSPCSLTTLSPLS